MAIFGFRGATAFADAYDPGKDTPVQCNWSDLALGNQMGNWKPTKADIKYAYDHDLKGQEIQAWWPGRSAKGECNDLSAKNRGCWYRGKLLNDAGCSEENRCLHIAAHDGEPRHTYTCPTWIRDPKGVPCSLPDNWQACPTRFDLKRVDSGVPQEFKAALAQTCSGNAEVVTGGDAAAASTAPSPAGDAAASSGGGSATVTDHCLGSTSGEPANMIFDLRHNSWYRCTDKFRCEAFDIRAIRQPEQGECGTGTQCRASEQCFVHRVTSKQSAYECVDNKKVWLLSDGDDVAKFSLPAPLVVFGPPRTTFASRRSRQKARHHASFL